MKIVMIDNYDSFTYNLVYMINKIVGKEIDVIRNDQFELQDLDKYDTIFLSPGPGVPKESGLLLDVIQHYYKHKNIFGICLGMQAMGEVFGSELLLLDTVYHGMATDVHIIKKDIIYKNIPKIIKVGRYHSWVVKEIQKNQDIETTSIDKNGAIMSLKHKKYNVKGVQYHPESILSPQGNSIIANFLESCQ